MVFAIGTGSKRAVAAVLTLLLLTAIPAPLIRQAVADSYVTDGGVHAPPSSGAYAYYPSYGAFGPDQSGFPRQGESFVDPVFGRSITRLTNEMGQSSFSEIYSKNGYFNADGTLVHHRSPSGHNIVSTRSGQIVRAGVTFNYDSSFAPDDSDAYYYFAFGDTTLYKYSVSSGNRTVVKTFPGALASMGGSVDWIDRSGRYMVLNIGGVTRVYDKQADVLYAGSIPGNYGAGDGWRGISPDANYVITSTSGSPTTSHSWKIDHASQTVSTTPVLFWTLCGGHGDVVSASNGKTYFVSFDCNSTISIYAIDVSLPQSASNVAQQLSQNKKLMQVSWSDSGHFSRVSKGAWQDWMYVSVESGDDNFTSTVADWRAFKQEIVRVNVLTGEVQRLAHHRSRGLGSGNYYYQPRVSATWDGSVVLWTSNFGYSGTNYADLYAMNMADGGSAPAPAPAPILTPAPPKVSLGFVNPASGATVSNTVTVSLSASGGSGSGYVYSVTAGGATVYTGSNNSFSWNTTSSANGSVTLTAKVTDSAGATAQASQTVNVSNTTTNSGGSTGSTDTVVPTVSITSPSSTVWTGNSIRVAAKATDNVGLDRIELWGGGRVFATVPCGSTNCNANVWWTTGALPAGSYIVNAVAVDKAGNRARSAPVTIVKDATSPTYPSGAPATSATTSSTTPTASPTTLTASPTTPTTGDTTPPTAAITSPPSGTWTGNSLQVSLQGTDNVLMTKLELYANGQLANTVACSSATCASTVTWNSGPLPSGQHTLTAVATDSSGNRTTSAPVTINK